ncbi:MAG: T9SS type A sorting domain-containing protein [Bacteroidia bacterium]
MIKKAFSIIIVTSIVIGAFVTSCKKDPPTTPLPVVPVIETPPLQISVYPNPSSGKFTVQTNANTQQTVKMFSMIGKLIFSKTINGTTSFNEDSLASGVYLLSITTNTITTNKKIVIVK